MLVKRHSNSSRALCCRLAQARCKLNRRLIWKVGHSPGGDLAAECWWFVDPFRQDLACGGRDGEVDGDHILAELDMVL